MKTMNTGVIVLWSLFATMQFGMARTLYWAGGSVDVADGTPVPSTVSALSGTWDKTTKNWAVDAAGSAYVAWEDGADAVAWLPSFVEQGVTATLTLAEDVTLNQIVAPHTTPAVGYNHAYSLTAASARTLTLTGTNPSLWVSDSDITRQLIFLANVSLAATNGFAKTGSGSLYLNSVSPDVFGTVVVNGYSGLQINNTAALLGVSEFDLRGQLTAMMSSGANDRISDDAIIRLRGGAPFSPSGVASATESIKQIRLNASGVIGLSTGSGAPRGRFIATDAVQGLDRGPDGTGTLYFYGNAGDAFQTDVVVENGIATGVLLPWAFTLQSRPVQLNADTKAFEPLAVVPAPADLATWVPGSRYRMEGSYTPSGTLGSITLESLGIYNSNGPFTLNLAADATLTLSSGQLGMNPNGTGGWKTFSGGRLTSGSEALYLLTGNSGAASTLSIASAITGDIDVVKGGAPYVVFSGAATNTYTGTTYVNHGRLVLSRTSNQGSIPGGLVVNRGGIAHLDAGAVYQINTNANITLREGGTLLHNDSAAQVYSGVVTFEGGTVSLGGTGNGATFNRSGTGLVFANGGTITQTYNGYSMPMWLLTDVRSEAAATNQALFTTAYPNWQFLDLTTTSAATRTFDVSDAVGLVSTSPEMVIDIPIRETWAKPASLLKTGDGVLQLQRLSGRWSGEITVNDGTLVITGPSAPETAHTYTWSGGGYPNTLIVDNTNGLIVGQSVKGPLVNAANWMTIQSINPTTRAVQFANYASLSTASSSGTVVLTNRACSAAGMGNISVGSGGILAGDSQASGNVTVSSGGTLAPGTPAAPVGTLRIAGTLDMSAGGTLRIDIADETTHDRLSVAGNLFLSGSVEPILAAGFNPASGEWVIAT